MAILNNLRLSTLLLTLAVCISGLLFPVVYEQPQYFFLAVILIIGIPHGALDHLLHFKDKGRSAFVKSTFYGSYLIAVFFVFILWYFNADIAFGFFLLISAYHFGESQMVGIKVSKKGFKLLSFFWGITLLSGIIFFNIEECLNLFQATKILIWFERSSIEFWKAIFMFSLVGWIATAGILYFFHFISLIRIFYETISLVFLIFLADTTNAVFCFSVYFAFWHSLPSLLLEIEKLNDSRKFNISVLKNLFPFTVVSYIGLVGLYLFTSTFFESLSIFLPFFVLVSALTLPHLFVTHVIYSRK